MGTLCPFIKKKDEKRKEDRKMTVGITFRKFIVTKDKVFFGNKKCSKDSHLNISEENKISRDLVLGGGIADMEDKEVFGYSSTFGKYDKEVVQDLLPEWKVNEPDVPEKYRYCIEWIETHG